MTIKFSKNWGCKLDGYEFTTIRENKGYWVSQVGKKHDVVLKGDKYCEAVLLWRITIDIERITESLAKADADMSREDLIKMLRKMYGENPALELLCWERVLGSNSKEASSE